MDKPLDPNFPQIPGSGPAPAAPPTPVPVYMAPPPPPPAPPAPPKKSIIGRLFRMFFILLLVVSLMLNFYLIGMFTGGIYEHLYRNGDHQNKIALLNLDGVINMKTADVMRRMFNKAAADDAVKGIIIVVNSPGGYVTPSNMISHYLAEFKKNTRKPVYVSVSQMDASGAYWGTAAADRIYAQQSSSVGSIGVIYMNLVWEDTMKKIGATAVVIKSTRSPEKDKGSPFRKPTEKEIQDITSDLNTIHERFVEVVSKGRQIPVDKVWTLATGDVFDGPEAIQNKLIDKIGFLDDAISDLSQSLNLQNPMIVRYALPPSFRNMLNIKQSGYSFDNLRQQMEKMITSPRIQALWLGD